MTLGKKLNFSFSNKIRVGQDTLIKATTPGWSNVYRPVVWTGTRKDFFTVGESVYEKYSQKELEALYSVRFPCLQTDIPESLYHKMYQSSTGLYYQENLPELFDLRDYREWIELGQTFIFPIRMEFDTALLYLPEAVLPEGLEAAVKQGLCTVVIESPWETRNLTWPFRGLDEFQKRHRFPKEQIVFCGAQAGTRVSKQVEGKLWTYKNIQYFREFCWPCKRESILVPKVQNELHSTFNYYLTTTIPRKLFLLEMGRATTDRVLMLAGLLGNKELGEKGFYSFRNHYEASSQNFADMISGILEALKDINVNTRNIEEALKTWDFTTNITLPEKPGTWFSLLSDEEFRRSSFLEVVPETNVFNETNSFITEKTYKPILTAKPFICCASVGFLKNLKEDGFQTFEKYWDESYDEEPNSYYRILKILDLLKSLLRLSGKEMMLMYRDMKPILKHNFNLLTSKKLPVETLKWYGFLEKENLQITKNYTLI